MFSDASSPGKSNAAFSAAAAKRVSIKDIARLARVSHSTVSRALRESPLVNPETAENIRRIAAESGFRASAVARSLATSRTSTIGVVVTSIDDPFVAEVVKGIEDEAIVHDYSVFLANCHADPDREMKVVHSFEDRRVDGIVVTASRVGALYGPVLERMRIPIVLLNNQHPSQFAHSIVIDNFEGSRQAVAHLIELGHTRVAYIGDRFGHGSDSERFSGYRAALDAADVPFQPELILHGDGKAEGGRLAMEKLLAHRRRPTAVFCYNDMTAIGALKAIRARGLRVPADISLVGFDDLPLSLFVDPPLTTVHQPKQEMGRMAMQALLKLMAGSEAEQNVRVSGELLIRQSTAAPPDQPTKENQTCNYSSAPRKGRKRK
ncbi:MAG: LacI family DNA-binding transcriptional regulator [Acidobacteria bacterium]|nr:LacI family DNA-binding transcriptional regulator [Acidobacteriota bacterium]